jgi:hypothetical protein
VDPSDGSGELVALKAQRCQIERVWHGSADKYSALSDRLRGSWPNCWPGVYVTFMTCTPKQALVLAQVGFLIGSG